MADDRPLWLTQPRVQSSRINNAGTSTTIVKVTLQGSRQRGGTEEEKQVVMLSLEHAEALAKMLRRVVKLIEVDPGAITSEGQIHAEDLSDEPDDD